MDIKIKATNIELTPVISDYIHDKIGGVRKFITAKDPSSVNVYFEIEKTTERCKSGENLYRAEANLQIDGKLFRSEETSVNIKLAINQVRDDISRIVKTKQSKHRTLFRKGGIALKRLFKGFSK